jgi:hypothetical protein
MESLRLPQRDRAMLGLLSVGAIGPARMPSVQAVRRAVWDLVAIDPENRLLHRVDVRRGRFIPVPPAERAQFVDEVVIPLDDEPRTPGKPWAEKAQIKEVADAVYRRGLGDLPFRIRVGRNFSIFELMHAVGDGSMYITAWSTLLGCACDGSMPTALVQKDSMFPLLRAAYTTFGEHPGRLVDLYQVLRSSHATSEAGTGEAAGGGLVAGAVRPAVRMAKEVLEDVVPAARSALTRRSSEASRMGAEGDSSHLVSVATLSRYGLMREIREWRNQHRPDATALSIIFAAGVVAVEESDLPRPAPGIGVMLNARRYLPKGTSVAGNFVVVMELDLENPRSPEAIAAANKKIMDSGRPLATMMALVTKSVFRPTDSTVESAETGRPKLVFTAPGAFKGFEKVPWLLPLEQIWFDGVTTPSGRDGITFSFHEIGEVINVKASFDATRYDFDTIAGVVARLANDPIGLLEPLEQLARTA